MWEIKNDRPIYIQLADKIRQRIITGVYRPGDKLPSVRDLAQEAGVNPNTMQKALTELERSDLVYAQRTSGRFITEDAGRIKKMREDIALEQAQAFLNKMADLGFSRVEIVALMERAVAERG